MILEKEDPFHSFICYSQWTDWLGAYVDQSPTAAVLHFQHLQSTGLRYLHVSHLFYNLNQFSFVNGSTLEVKYN